LPWVWIAWIPILYYVCGDPVKDLKHGKTNVMSIIGGWLVVLLNAIKFGNTALQEDVAVAVELEKNDLQQEANVVAQELLKKASDPLDGRSFYPLFIESELDEPSVAQHSTMNKVRIWLFTLLVAFLALQPTVQSALAGDTLIYCSWATLINVSTALALAYTVHGILEEVETVTDDFSDCVDEVHVFLFLAATEEMRNSETLKERFADIMQKNTNSRKWFADNNIKRKDNRIGFDTIVREVHGRRGSGSENDGVCSRAISAPTTLDEVKNRGDMDWCAGTTFTLQSRRFELYLNSRDGLKLFRRMYRWVSVDVTNEAFEASVQSNLVLLMAVFIMAFSIARLIENKMHLEVEHTVGIFAAVVLFVYFFRLCMLCIAMNEAVFGEVDQLLMEWKALASHPGKEVARMWDKTLTETECVKIFPSTENEITTERIPVEVRAMLDVTRERIKVLDKPSTLMGFAITMALLKKILTIVGASTATLVVALAKQFIHEHSKKH